MGVLVIAQGRTIIFRSALFVGLGSVVATIIYLTPVPDQYPQSCSRSCHELDWPMICRMRLTLERYRTLSGACGNCPKNVTECYDRRCVTGDGRERGILTVNRQFPGPNIQVCQNDIVVVDVVNRVPGQSFGVHWRGQDQRETPHMDGVPMVTQCPIPSFTTFQYKFRASREGTHMWQVNTGEEMLETLFGALVVRKPESMDMHRELYDLEWADHVITIHSLGSEDGFLHRSTDPWAMLLINGKSKENGFPAASFTVVPGKRHRFRAIVGGDSNGCRIRLSIDDHELLVFALDGNPVRPTNVTSVLLTPGERADFVLTANRPAASYRVRATPDESCRGLKEVTADLLYHEGQKPLEKPQVAQVTTDASTPELSTVTDEECKRQERKRLCPNGVESPIQVPQPLAQDPDHKFYLFYNLRLVTSREAADSSFIGLEDSMKVPQANNVTMTFPSSPLLSQSHDVSPQALCEAAGSSRSQAKETCECTHILGVRLDANVELVLVRLDDGAKPHRVFHLHGYAFHLVGSTSLAGKDATPDEITRLDADGLLVDRNLRNPIVKDTVALPHRGVAVIRFKADNPGYWMLDEEHSSSWSRGMSVIVRVGKDSDVPSPPPNFPKCGNWIGPDFFLV